MTYISNLDWKYNKKTRTWSVQFKGHVLTASSQHKDTTWRWTADQHSGYAETAEKAKRAAISAIVDAVPPEPEAA